MREFEKEAYAYWRCALGVRLGRVYSREVAEDMDDLSVLAFYTDRPAIIFRCAALLQEYEQKMATQPQVARALAERMGA